MLKIPHELFTLIKQHGENSFPQECVGVLLGKCNAETKVVHSLIPVENSATSKRTEFAISEADLLKAEKEGCEKQLACACKAGSARLFRSERENC